MTSLTEAPRTAAGRRLLEDLEGLHQPQKALRRILAIEAEAAAPASPDVVDEEAVLDNAVPSIARFGRVPRTEVIRSIVTAIHEQGMRVAALRAAAPAPLDVERLAAAMTRVDMGMYWNDEPRQIFDPPNMRRMAFNHAAYARDIAAAYAATDPDAKEAGE